MAGELLRNPRLAEMLTSLAKANSVEPFYRGDIARIIADGFRKNGGLVTSEDMAAYKARLVEPLTMAWGEHAIHTAPLTAGGLSVLQMLRALQALDWEHMPAGLARTHARLEAMRLAWRDRLSLLGDPEFVEVPVAGCFQPTTPASRRTELRRPSRPAGSWRTASRPALSPAPFTSVPPIVGAILLR